MGLRPLEFFFISFSAGPSLLYTSESDVCIHTSDSEDGPRAIRVKRNPVAVLAQRH